MSRFRIQKAEPGPAVWPDQECCPAWAHHRSREYLKKRGISKEESYAYHLHYAEKGFWADRLLIPQYDQTETLLFFQGRSLEDEEPRYRTSGARGTYRPVRNNLVSPRLIIVEGPFDSFTVYRIHPAVVATLGTQVSQRQLEEILALKPSSIAILYDRDAMRDAYALQLRLQPFVPTEVLICPGKDPAEISEELLKEVLKISP